MNRLLATIIVSGAFMIHAADNLSKEYAIGKNVTLSIEKRMAYIIKQACMIDERLHEPIKKMLGQTKSSRTVLNDLSKRGSSAGSRALSWAALENCLKKKGTDEFLLFGFGSLINKRTNYQPNINIPGVAFGVKRLYNVKHADPKDSVLGLPTTGYDHECLRLNVQLTKRPTDLVNGLLLKFAIGTKDYEDLKKREQLYRLVSIKVLLYSSLLQCKPIFKDAYILVSVKDKSSSTGDPHVVYNSLVMDGCKEIEDKGFLGFLSLFLDTTYLSDGKTTVRDWIRRSCRKFQHLIIQPKA